MGVRYESGSIVTDVRASNVIIATGRFIQNEGMLRDYYSGSVMYGTGNQYNDGAGIRLASRPVPRWARTSAPLSMSPAPAT